MGSNIFWQVTVLFSVLRSWQFSVFNNLSGAIEFQSPSILPRAWLLQNNSEELTQPYFSCFPNEQCNAMKIRMEGNSQLRHLHPSEKMKVKDTFILLNIFPPSWVVNVSTAQCN